MRVNQQYTRMAGYGAQFVYSVFCLEEVNMKRYLQPTEIALSSNQIFKENVEVHKFDRISNL